MYKNVYRGRKSPLSVVRDGGQQVTRFFYLFLPLLECRVLARFGQGRGGAPFCYSRLGINLCGNQTPSSRRGNGGNLASMALALHAVKQMQLRGRRRVDGVGRPKSDSHTGSRGGL